MTRVYEKDSLCCSCRQPGQFGWLYRCTQDIEQIVDVGPPSFDPPRPDSTNGMEMSDKLGSGDTAVNYTPEHADIISRQLEEVKNMIARDEFRTSSAALFNTTRPPPNFESYTNDSIYAGRPACADRAYLDMGAIADGKLPLTATIGFGFEEIGGRPVASSEVVKRIGKRGPPMIFTPPESLADEAFLNDYLLLMLDEKVASGSERSQRRTKDDLDTLEPPSLYRAIKSDADVMKALSNTHRRRSSKSTLAPDTYLELLPSLEDMPTPSQGRERTESPTRSAIELDRARQLRGEPQDDGKSSPLFHTDDSWDSEDLLSEFDDDACEFTPAPLRVDRGVGVTEESVEIGVPDAVTQM
ncbi:hypothetical protein N0V84_004366 [Fusarium piperis]|uniref:Uncharacterized protein n=1 Tax=Fusarium piperis TaxID=1435070 RepID=A0A9W8WFR9_9HYPO|nr:hypothetical protein N0V84_004366 [Fusarium piperis]